MTRHRPKPPLKSLRPTTQELIARALSDEALAFRLRTPEKWSEVEQEVHWEEWARRHAVMMEPE